MRQIFVDSRDRVSGTSADFSIELRETLVIEEGGHKARIDQLRIPLTIPTIETGDNDTIKVLVGATNYTIHHNSTSPVRRARHCFDHPGSPQCHSPWVLDRDLYHRQNSNDDFLQQQLHHRGGHICGPTHVSQLHIDLELV